MAWLISHRAKVKGQLDRAEALLATLPERIASYRADLAAIDAVIPKHEVKVDPTVIRGKRPQAPRLFQHGQLTREILRILRLAAPRPVFTAEIAFQVARSTGLDVAAVGDAALMDCIGRRLRALADLKLVRRHHPQSTRSAGSWSLMSTAIEGDAV